MFDVNVTGDLTALCLGQLLESETPLTAIEPAERLGLAGQRESRRRKVRAIVTRLRNQGVKIVGSNRDGYKITDDPNEWHKYLEGRQNGARRIFGETHRRKKESGEGCQGFLFGPARGIPD